MKVWMIRFLIIVFLTVSSQQTVFGANTKQSSDSKEAKKYKEILKKDMERDRKTKPKPLPKDRTVYRYTTKEQAKIETKKGIAPGSHLTAKGGPRRPLSAAEAKRRYGLKKTPEVRETVQLKKGDKVRSNRVIGGEKGLGELRATQREKVTKSLDLR